MTVTPEPRPGAVQEWLTVQEACVLIGVSPATLRRWSAAGDVQAFTTPGGHRRFARSTILGMLPSTRRQRPTLKHLGETPEHMTLVYRRHLAKDGRGTSWLAGVDADAVEPLRQQGRRIAGSLLAFIDATTTQEREAAMQDAADSATEHGRIAARGAAGIGKTVEAFLRFRMLFLGELAELSGRRGLDTVEATSLLVTATQAIDTLLVALMDGHESELTGTEHDGDDGDDGDGDRARNTA